MGYEIRDNLATKPEKILKLVAANREFEKELKDDSDVEKPAAKRLKK